MGTQITENSVHSVINAKHIARKINFCNLLEPYLRSLKTYFYTRKQTHAPLNNAACISGLGEAVYQTPVTKQRRLGVLGTRALWSLGPGGWTSGMQAWAGPAPSGRADASSPRVPSPCPHVLLPPGWSVPSSPLLHRTRSSGVRAAPVTSFYLLHLQPRSEVLGPRASTYGF